MNPIGSTLRVVSQRHKPPVRSLLVALAFSVVGATSASAQFTPQRGGVSAPPDDRPNIVLIVADDLGVDMVGCYHEGPSPACTPSIDALAAEGVLFRNAWASPICSPTRAQLLTGRYGFHNGIGANVSDEKGNAGIALPMRMLPEVLAGYDTSAIGKWHLGDSTQGSQHPLASGFQYYAGSMQNLSHDFDDGNYFNWIKDVNGVSHVETTYATVDTTNDAIERAASMQPPWFLYVAYNAPHIPAHRPPDEVCGQPSCAVSFCHLRPPLTEPEEIRAVVEAMDAEMGELIEAIRSIDPDVYIIFLGDNGTSTHASEAPFIPEHAKGTLYEGGLNVPLIIAGPGIAPRKRKTLVCVTDVFATITDWAHVARNNPDAVSLAPLLSGNANAPERAMVYEEFFGPNFNPRHSPFSPEHHGRAIRDAQYKLIRITDREGLVHDELYDLDTDPFEEMNLFPPTTPEEQAHYAALVEELARMGVD